MGVSLRPVEFQLAQNYSVSNFLKAPGRNLDSDKSVRKFHPRKTGANVCENLRWQNIIRLQCYVCGKNVVTIYKRLACDKRAGLLNCPNHGAWRQAQFQGEDIFAEGLDCSHIAAGYTPKHGMKGQKFLLFTINLCGASGIQRISPVHNSKSL